MSYMSMALPTDDWRNKTTEFEDFSTGEINLNWANTTSNGSSGFRPSTSEAGRPGILEVYKGQGLLQSAGCSSLHRSHQTLVCGPENSIYCGWSVRVPTLSSGSVTFVLQIGLGDNNETGAHDNGLWVEIPSDSNYFVLKSASNGSVTSYTTNIVPAANEWYRISIIYLSTANTTLYYIGGIFAGSVSTNIPITPIGENVKIYQVSGAAERSIHVDYCRRAVELSGER